MASDGDGKRLDLYSTSQTSFCIYGAPLVAIIMNGKARVKQACCNHWDCTHCGVERAKQEYRRIVNGCDVLSVDHKLYFWTITCRGKECSYDEAMENYYDWTNTLLTNARAKCSRIGGYWAYAQVTEHQKKTRLHPHSHLITTFLPDDAIGHVANKQRIEYISKWFSRANISAGLGEQCKISEVQTAAGASRYVAKYLFKAALSEQWPAKWKRVRYSQNWPKTPEVTPDACFTLLSPKDWENADKAGVTWIAESMDVWKVATHHLFHLRAPEAGV